MKDYITIGSSPPNEECAQLGSVGYDTKARAECQRFIDLIRKKHGDEPEGARLAIKGFPHDFGTYYEVVVWYNDQIPKSEEYALKVEGDAPADWNDDKPS